MGQQELTEWTKKNEEAQYDAIKTALNLFVDGGLAYLAESRAARDGLKGALAKYEKQLKSPAPQTRPAPAGKMARYEQAHRGDGNDHIRREGLAEKKEKAEIFWKYFTANTKDADQSVSSFKASLNAVQEEPILHKLLVDKGLMPLVNKFKTRELFPKKPYLINLAEFTRDYGYDVVEWTASRNRIIQQYNVTDEQLRAVNSMTEELKHTMGAINECVSRGFITRP